MTVKLSDTVIAFIGLGVEAPSAYGKQSDVCGNPRKDANKGPYRDTHMSQPSRTRASHSLNGGPPSRAKDHSCLELVVTVLTAQEIRRISIKVTNAIVAPFDRVAFRRTSTYG